MKIMKFLGIRFFLSDMNVSYTDSVDLSVNYNQHPLIWYFHHLIFFIKLKTRDNFCLFIFFLGQIVAKYKTDFNSILYKITILLVQNTGVES